ncbi:hypothetical protein PG995_001645 [Apiospora arundinis]|uniref:3-hydroxybenzoate 6-hydroxylase n=1 Tax=Apiospora arundinis TaxID=335852 RepID=A0ABR2J7H2_9PEZI
MPLEVGIIGAGIGGLSAAIALRRAGAHVEVFERSNFADEIGAAITITPNGSRILDAWGFNNDDAHVVEAAGMRMVDADDLEPVLTEEFQSLKGEFGAKMGFYHRAELHRVLREMAQSKDGSQPGKPVKLRLGEAVAHVDCENGVICMDCGVQATKDLVVVADGIRSQLVKNVTGRKEPAKDLGWSAYRCLIPMDSVLEDQDLRGLFASAAPGYWVPCNLPDAFYMVTYPCRTRRGQLLMNVALRHTTQPQNENKEDWNSPATVEEALDVVSPYHPLLGRLLQKAEEIKVHKLLRRDPLERYFRGRAVILGDAAHTIPPTHAQGAVLAIEEAAALETLFRGVCCKDLVPARLKVYSDVLKTHMHIVQHLSDTIPGMYDEYRQKAEELWGGGGDGLYPREAYNFSAPVRQFLYSYDVRAEIEEGMRKAGM